MMTRVRFKSDQGVATNAQHQCTPSHCSAAPVRKPVQQRVVRECFQCLNQSRPSLCVSARPSLAKPAWRATVPTSEASFCQQCKQFSAAELPTVPGTCTMTTKS